MTDIRIDTSSLTYTQFLIPEVSSDFVDGADAATIRLEPGVYGFQQISGSVANFRFEVTPDGVIDYDVENEEFLDGRGTTTLIVRGFKITLDATALSHDLLPMVARASILPRDSAHELTLVPASGYGFQSASGIVADFRFDVTTDGQIVIDSRYAGFARAHGRTLIIGRKRRRSPTQKVEALCRSIGIKESILPALAAVWQRYKNGESSRNEFEGEIYTVFDNISTERREDMAYAFGKYDDLRRDRTGDCLFDDGLANEVVKRPLEKAEFAAELMREGTTLAGHQLFHHSGGVMGPGLARPWRKLLTNDPDRPPLFSPPIPWPWLTAIKLPTSGNNEFGNEESFKPVPPATFVEPLDYQFEQTCEFVPDASGQIVAMCERIRPIGSGPFGGAICPGGSNYTVGDNCLRIPAQHAGGSIFVRGFNFLTPSVKVHLRSKDDPTLPVIVQECIAWGDREIPLTDEQGEVIADMRVKDWIDVPIPSQHPNQPGAPFPAGLYDIWVSVSEPGVFGDSEARDSNSLVIRIEPSENVKFLFRSDRGRCIKETPGSGDDEIWWDAFVGHLVPNNVPLDREGSTSIQLRETSRKSIPREPWKDMDDDKPATHVCNIFGPASFERNGVVIVAIVGFEVDSESAARRQLQGFGNVYFETLKDIAVHALGLEGAVTGLGNLAIKAGVLSAKVAFTAAIVAAAVIAAITLVSVAFWAAWAPADLIALDIFCLDAVTAWDMTDPKKPLPIDSTRQFRGKFDDEDVLVKVTQRALPKDGNLGESSQTWVQENQYNTFIDGDEDAVYALEFRLTRTSV
jgi:hypothetical protein